MAKRIKAETRAKIRARNMAAAKRARIRAKVARAKAARAKAARAKNMAVARAKVARAKAARAKNMVAEEIIPVLPTLPIRPTQLIRIAEQPRARTHTPARPILLIQLIRIVERPRAPNLANPILHIQLILHTRKDPKAKRKRVEKVALMLNLCSAKK